MSLKWSNFSGAAKILILSPIMVLLIGGLYLANVFQHRKQSAAAFEKKSVDDNLTLDDLAVVRVKSPAHFDDASDIDNTAVWMKNGYTMPYYPYVGGSVQFAKRVGLLAPGQKLQIIKLVKQAAPPAERNNISHGTKQVLATFTLPGSPTVYATPIGVIAPGEEHYFSDLLFFYDDPHGIYDNWSKDTWAVIDSHQVKLGMNELQVQTSLGLKIETKSQDVGNRVITYDVNGKKTTVTFEKNRATKIE